MKSKNEQSIDIVDKHKLKMNNIFNVVLLLLVSALIMMPGASANPVYFGALQSVYGTTGTSCSTCHTSPPALNSYGNAFAAIPSHNSNPTDALVSIGAPPGVPAPKDIIPPETNISGVIENGLYNNNVTITLTATDNMGGSGVKETIFSINGGPATTYVMPFVVNTTGQDNVTYWSTDNAGNIELPGIINFTISNGSAIDIIPPETNICGVTENGLYKNNVTICFTASDNMGGSGVKETIFSVNGGQTATYTVPFIVDTLGKDNVTYWSADNAGNIESQKMVNFTITNEEIDTIPPITNLWGVTENGLYNSNVTVSLTAMDNPGGSGVKETIFSVNGGQTTTYTMPFVVDKLGQDNVTYWSMDNAGNIESPKMVNFTFVPSINATRAIERISILPGESTNINVSITSSVNQALNLHEIIPEGWNVTFTSDSDGFKNSTNEWILFEILPEVPRSITYTLTSPVNVSIGAYQINGTISNDGIVENVSGNESIKIDILEFYRRLGNDPAIIETGDLMEAINDFRNGIAPSGFDRPLDAQEIGELVNEWTKT